MKSKANVLIRIVLAIVFCLGMVGATNPVAGQRDRGDRGDRERCQRDCQEKYNQEIRDCNGKRGRERRECRRRADHDRKECRKNCHHRR